MPEKSHSTGAVFLSYASQDADAAARICEALQAVGVEVWFDRSELRGGDAWDLQIKKQIHECALFVPLISRHTNSRVEGYFRREWNLAKRRLLDRADDAAFLVPVVIDETREADARVPEEFLHAQWTWLPGGEIPPAFASRVRELLGGSSAVVGPEPPHASGVHDQGAPATPPGQPSRAFTSSKTLHMRKVGTAAIALLLVLGFGLFRYHQRTGDMPAEKSASDATPVAVTAPDQKSIAVLPFVDMSADKNQEYMSDGIAEELLNLLAQVPDLKVIARTSSFAFKGQSIDVAEIAKRLNVAHILEGSVRKSGNKLRITAQLVRTADSTHLWSERYDRSMDDIFTVQDEIASAIVQALQIKLAGGELRRPKGGTQNLEAYQLYMRAVSANLGYTRSSLEAADEFLQQAINLDPNYGRAWSYLSAVLANKADNGFLTAEEGYEGARHAAQRASQLSPELAMAHSRLQYIHLNYDWDWTAAEADGRRALAISRTDPDVLNIAGVLSYTLGRWDDAVRHLRGALAVDPLNTYTMWNLGFAYYGGGQFAESEAMYRKLLEVEPSFGSARNYLALTVLAQRRPKEALAIAQEQVDVGEQLRLLPIFLQAAGRQAESDEALRAQYTRWARTGAFYIAMTYAYRGDHDQAIEWLERAHKQRDSWLGTILGEHVFKSMAGDPRYEAFLRKLKLRKSEGAT